MKPSYFCPILRTEYNGNLIFERVVEYNSRWLKQTKDGEDKQPDEYESLCPFDMWMDHCWLFVRRMVGDYLCQKILYGVCTFIWITNGVEKGKPLRRYQDALIENVFQIRNKAFFLDNQKKDTAVKTFDGQFEGYLAWEELEKIVAQVCVLGPIAGLYGRVVEQFLINPRREDNCYIPERIFIKSVDETRVSLKKEWLYEAPKRPTFG